MSAWIAAVVEQLAHLRERLPDFFGLAMAIGGGAPPSWRQIGAHIVAGIVIGVVGGAGGGYVVLKVDQAVQESRLAELERRMGKAEDNLRTHEINGAIHYYGARR